MYRRGGSRRRKEQNAFFRVEALARKEPTYHGAACGKKCIPSHGQAKATVKAILHSGQDRYAGTGKVLCSYYCERCSAWHVGNADPPGRPYRPRPIS